MMYEGIGLFALGWMIWAFAIRPIYRMLKEPLTVHKEETVAKPTKTNAFPSLLPYPTLPSHHRPDGRRWPTATERSQMPPPRSATATRKANSRRRRCFGGSLRCRRTR